MTFNQMEHKAYFGTDIASTNGKVHEVGWYDFLKGVVDAHFEAYTVSRVEGVWKGKREDTYVLSVISFGGPVEHHKAHLALRACALVYKFKYDQDAVLVTSQPIEATLV